MLLNYDLKAHKQNQPFGSFVISRHRSKKVILQNKAPSELSLSVLTSETTWTYLNSNMQYESDDLQILFDFAKMRSILKYLQY